MARPSLIPLAVYADTSSHRNHTYMVAGALAFRQSRYAEFEATAQAIKSVHGITREMKWSDYRGGPKRPAYEAMIDLLFTLTENKQAAFHCLIAKFDEFTHRLNPGDTSDTSANRMYFQLFLHRVCRLYGPRCKIYIYPDVGNDSRDIPKYRDGLCAAAYRRFSAAPNCIRSISPQDSKTHNTMQIVDIVIGGIAAKCNAIAGGHKAALADYILTRAGRKTWAVDSSRHEKYMTVWNFRHSRAPRAAVRPAA